MIIFRLLDILRVYLPQKKRLMPCRSLWKKKLLKLEARSLDEKEEESDEQKEEEWSSYPCLPSNESHSLINTLFDCTPCSPKEGECYDPMDSFEVSLFDETAKNDFVVYDNLCYIDKSYDNPLFIPTIEMHINEDLCLEILYVNALVRHHLTQKHFILW